MQLFSMAWGVAVLGDCCQLTHPLLNGLLLLRRWRDDGSWKRIHDHPLVPWVKVAASVHWPVAASLNSQSVPTAVMVHESVGYDAGKRSKGANASHWLIRWDCWLQCRLWLPMCRRQRQAIASAGAPGTLSPTSTSDYHWVDGGFSGKSFSNG